MREVTASGETVKDAIQSALKQLNATEDQVDIHIIDEGKRGLFGIFGAKLAIVNVTMSENQIEETENFINEVTKNMNLDLELKTTVSDRHVKFELSGKQIALLIGKRGQTLNALQYLVQLVLNKNGKHFYRVTLDAQGYRERRKRTLESLAMKMADKAKRINKKVALEPMPPYERKIIHTRLQNLNNITTYSEGVEPHRYLIIEP